MKLIDISIPIHKQTIVWPGDEPVIMITDGPGMDDMTITKFRMGAHTGTHIDAPRHFLPQGKTLDQIPLDRFIGTCEVVTIPQSAPEITLRHLKHISVVPGSRILFKTKNSQIVEKGSFSQDYTALSLEAAQFLADRQVSLVGLDYLSIEPYNSPGHQIHKTLFQKGVIVLEGLYLDHVTKGTYKLICLPISMYGVDGAPCRAVLEQI